MREEIAALFETTWRRTLIAFSLLAILIFFLWLICPHYKSEGKDLNLPEVKSEKVVSDDVKPIEVNFPKKPCTITVTGVGKVSFVPTITNIDLTLTTQDESSSVAWAKNKSQMNKIIQFLKSAGINERDLRTSQLSIFPIIDYRQATTPYNKRSEIVGYRVTQSLYVKIQNIEKVGQIIDGVVKLGALISQIYFSDSPESYVNKALVLAEQDARRKAEDLARAEGRKHVYLLNCEEIDRSIPGPRYFGMEVAQGEKSTEPMIERGESEVVVRIRATFEAR